MIKFEKDGLHEYKWCPKKKKDVRKKVKKLRVLTHLRDRCEIDEGVTLLDIFRTVGRYKMLMTVISEYSWCRDMEAFHAQAEEPISPDPDNEQIAFLEIYWSTDYTPRTHGGKVYRCEKGKPVEFSIEPAFHGIGPIPNWPEYEGQTGDTQYAVDFSPMWELAHLPVRLNKKAQFWKTYDKDVPPLVLGNRDFSLLDVLDAIYWEISFVGGPAEKSDKNEELKSTLDEIKDGDIEAGLADGTLVEWNIEDLFGEHKEDYELVDP